MSKHWRSFSLLSLATLLACTTPERKPSSTDTTVEIPQELPTGVGNFYDYIRAGHLNAGNCAKVLGELYTQLYAIDPAHFNRDRLASEINLVIDLLFKTRLQLRKVLTSVDDVECVASIRDTLRAARFIEEYLIEWQGPLPQGRVFGGTAPQLMINPDFKKLELESGDILLSRGTAFLSAAIARIGDSDSQFSHLALVHKDEQTRTLSIIEATVEKGVSIVPFEKYTQDPKARVVVFRHPDRQLARKAADQIFKRASEQNIPYDFQMNLNDPSEMFCAELPYVGYREASEQKFILPLFKTGISMKNRSFLDALGIRGNEVFAPGDMEVDARFELVAEWRDFSSSLSTRIKDAVLSSMFDWMERLNYQLEPLPAEKMQAEVLMELRRWPMFEPYLQDKFPTNIPIATMTTSFTLNKVGEKLAKELETAHLRHVAAKGLPMTPKQMHDYLEQVRAKDYALYEQSKPQSRNEKEHALFHDRFHPPEALSRRKLKRVNGSDT